jgi:glycosyltransferase involved in cell wall biosynthesis
MVNGMAMPALAEADSVAAGSSRDLEVSVIVPVRDGGAGLEELLDCLAAQTIPRQRFEIVVGDDGSSDGWTEIFQSDDGWTRVTSDQPQNSYVARNRAAGLARGHALAFCDADCRPAPEWLAAGLAALADADLAGGRIEFVADEQPSVWGLLDVDTFLDQERAVGNGRAVTANLFVRREVYEHVGGFDDSLPNHGDYDFAGRCIHAGARLVYAPDAVVRHPIRDRARAFLGKLWRVNRMYARRESSRSRRPARLRLRSWVPLVQPVRTRRHFGRSLGLDRARLGEHGLRPRLRDELVALPLMYLLIPYFSNVAQLRGWLEGRRAR